MSLTAPPQLINESCWSFIRNTTVRSVLEDHASYGSYFIFQSPRGDVSWDVSRIPHLTGASEHTADTKWASFSFHVGIFFVQFYFQGFESLCLEYLAVRHKHSAILHFYSCISRYKFVLLTSIVQFTDTSGVLCENNKYVVREYKHKCLKMCSCSYLFPVNTNSVRNKIQCYSSLKKLPT